MISSTNDPPTAGDWGRNALIGAAVVSFRPMLTFLVRLSEGAWAPAHDASAAVVAGSAAGAVAGLVFTGLYRLRRLSTAGYYAAWVPTAWTVFFALFALGAVAPGLGLGEAGVFAANLSSPRALLFWLSISGVAGLLIGRWMRD